MRLYPNMASSESGEPVKQRIDFEAGFSLIELALVMAVVALLIGGLLVPLTMQIEQQKIRETQKAMEEIKEALVGYAIIHGSFPCPTTQADPENTNYGVADNTCITPSAEGYIPWKTLGVAETDAWGIKRAATTSPWIGYWRYRVDSNFSNAGTPFTLTTGFADNLAVQDSSGKQLTTTTERPVAIIFSTGKDTTANGENQPTPFNGVYQSDVPSQTFDDMVVWLSRPTIFNRMVAAGRLP